MSSLEQQGSSQSSHLSRPWQQQPDHLQQLQPEQQLQLLQQQQLQQRQHLQATPNMLSASALDAAAFPLHLARINANSVNNIMMDHNSHNTSNNFSNSLNNNSNSNNNSMLNHQYLQSAMDMEMAARRLQGGGGDLSHSNLALHNNTNAAALMMSASSSSRRNSNLLYNSNLIVTDAINPTSRLSNVPRTISSHTHLLEPNDPDGTRLYAYYRLSIDEMFRLPPTVRPQDLLLRIQMTNGNNLEVSGASLATLSAAHFAELALGALVHNEVAWAMELCNAVVHCLRDSCQDEGTTAEPQANVVQFEIARAYFLLGVFRACRGDMLRYFKYRSVCLGYLGKLEVRIYAVFVVWSCVWVQCLKLFVFVTHPCCLTTSTTAGRQDDGTHCSDFLSRLLGLHGLQWKRKGSSGWLCGGWRRQLGSQRHVGL
jgi:hypothetical protein